MTLPVCFYPNGGDSSFSLAGGLQASGGSFLCYIIHLEDFSP